MSERPILISGVDTASDGINILFVGAALAATKNTFGKGGKIRCEHADASSGAIELMSARAQGDPFDCIMVDMRHREDGSALNVVAIAALQSRSTIVVLCQPEQVDTFRALTGVHTVLPAPVAPKAIMDAISSAVERRKRREPVAVERRCEKNEPALVTVEGDSVSQSKVTQPEGREELIDIEELARASAAEAKRYLALENGVCDVQQAPALKPVASALVEEIEEAVSKQPDVDAIEDGDDIGAAIVDEPEVEPAGEAETVEEPAPVAQKVTNGFETTLSKVQDADQQVWQRFVPLANFLYKKLAIVVLSALFLTFLAYGAMIVFFMSSSSWSLPFELSRGHLLVEKTERDLSSLRLRRNQVQQEINTAGVEHSQAQRERRDGEKQLLLTRRTVEEEIILQKTQKLEIKEHIARLKKVIRDFNKLNGRGGFAKSLDSAYARRLITRKSLNSGTLAVLETLHRIATVQNEISVKQIELQRTTRKLEFLESLLAEITQPEVRVITSAGSDLSYLARDAIEAKNRIALAARTEESLTKRLAKLENSHQVLSDNLNSLLETPAARALKAPVMVLFVPYTNADEVTTGEPLYSCALSIFACSKVGDVGKPVRGETTAVHPLFGKPMRGTFMEASFRNAKSVTAELVHAGRRPLLF
ncbi:MAG: hypothetical protein ACR2PF_08700 [Rhizobiaceae bacterium]